MTDDVSLRDVDRVVLSVLVKEGNMTPYALSREGSQPRTSFAASYLGKRMRQLADLGLAERLSEDGLYGVTEAGKAAVVSDHIVWQLAPPGPHDDPNSS